MDDEDFHHPVMVILTIVLALIVVTWGWIVGETYRLWRDWKRWCRGSETELDPNRLRP